MSYLDTFLLTGNFEFQSRIAAAATQQALIFINDERPEFREPARLVIISSGNAAPFVALVAGQPEMTAESTDGDILAALQFVWPEYGAALLNEPVTPGE
jgi:hypothetical protein